MSFKNKLYDFLEGVQLLIFPQKVVYWQKLFNKKRRIKRIICNKYGIESNKQFKKKEKWYKQKERIQDQEMIKDAKKQMLDILNEGLKNENN